ncbi:hypothetical protein [Acetobacter senegalensis]|uniref:hypothetical protein n=1 Tax=Acetobacter senegalensis TaxID=446692 RepID=UPI001EDC4BA9|nr:hypothetical protein [Acetobacter senegalensis]MCG4258036.1 hypothetical protein [Acetobacter senegalensis]MCG4267963.1 hypothetical protein [Acetobacter senegalensis]
MQQLLIVAQNFSHQRHWAARCHAARHRPFSVYHNQERMILMHSDDEEASVSLTEFEQLQQKVLSLEYAVRALFVAASHMDNSERFYLDFQKEMDRQVDQELLKEVRALRENWGNVDHSQGPPSFGVEACNLKTYVSTGTWEEPESDTSNVCDLPSGRDRQTRKDLKELRNLAKQAGIQFDQED